MAVKASANITLFDMVDIDGVTNYYLLQSSTANPPAKPTTDNPGGNWSTTEPTYTEGSTNTLYTVMKTKFSDGTFEYTPVSKSSSYEAAKSAYNKASNAQTTANTANDKIDNLQKDVDFKFSDLIIGTQTAKTGSWTGVANFSELKNGQQITYWLPYDGSGNATLNLTLSDGTTTGAIPCYYGRNSRLTTHYSAGNIIRMVYMVDIPVEPSSNTSGPYWLTTSQPSDWATNYNKYYYTKSGSTYTKVSGTSAPTWAANTYYSIKITGWWADANYVDGNTYDRIRYNQNFKAKVAINKYNFIGAWEDGLYLPIVAGAEIDITKPILYFNSSSNIAANATNSNGYLSYPAVSLRNTISGWTGTLYASVYLKGELNGNLFTLDETNPYTCTVPTSDDGNTYVLLGQCIGNDYSVTLIPEHPLYRFFDGEFKALSQIAADYRAELNESISNAQANAIAAAAQNTSNQMNDYNETIKATYSTKTDVTTDINKTYGLIQQNFVTKAIYNNMDDRVNSAEATLAVLRSAITQFAGYYLTDEIPDDWATNYTDYYTKNSNNVYIHVTGSTAPTWAANTYYKAGAYMEISSGNSNLKLRLENDIIRLMSGTTTLTKWRTDLFQVYQTITRVLNIGPPNAGHFSFIFNDDGSLSIRKVT